MNHTEKSYFNLEDITIEQIEQLTKMIEYYLGDGDEKMGLDNYTMEQLEEEIKRRKDKKLSKKSATTELANFLFKRFESPYETEETDKIMEHYINMAERGIKAVKKEVSYLDPYIACWIIQNIINDMGLQEEKMLVDELREMAQNYKPPKPNLIKPLGEMKRILKYEMWRRANIGCFTMKAIITGNPYFGAYLHLGGTDNGREGNEERTKNIVSWLNDNGLVANYECFDEPARNDEYYGFIPECSICVISISWA